MCNVTEMFDFTPRFQMVYSMLPALTAMTQGNQ